MRKLDINLKVELNIDSDIYWECFCFDRAD